ncbi:mannose-6-phosphate isomerase-like protein (cupin superfamily) [Pedobacter cryoconitis]|uniref:cupin domain-containing protein n=1 Tax=Pedobacter cryoconitis TaxID=188932 RepID=UPI001610B888|nr:cupin domain-containing protein [Pedobacter cryoconitis]MBB6271888.1 mannose-6-phosphate isomerase-like protein (cupin superfamily) [Pedobacter cryoconitis]
MEALTQIDLHQISEAVKENYTNLPLNMVNDHVIRMGIMTAPFYWHYHPNSDESFLVLEGVLLIEMEDRIIELSPGQLFTIPTNVLHRTRPQGQRSVNLTFELENMQTIKKQPKIIRP